MADDSSSPATLDLNSHKPEPSTPIPNLNPLSTPPPQQQLSQSQVASYAPGSLVPNLPPQPPFRPGMQFTQASNFQNPNSGVPPPGSMQPPNGMRPFTPMANGYPGIHGVPPLASLIEKRCKA
ncbi:hypothetical protein N665_0146s0024 [Sinapis alba]|nr:hypothetical protein N665_0146s0024 [Sinapis alba]